MIVHSERNLDLDWMIRNLEQMDKIGGKLLSDKLFIDVLDLVKECKRQENKDKRKGKPVINCDDYILKDISDIIMHAKVKKFGDEEDAQDIKICINNVKSPTIEIITSEWEASNKIIISMKDANMEMYYD